MHDDGALALAALGHVFETELRRQVEVDLHGDERLALAGGRLEFLETIFIEIASHHGSLVIEPLQVGVGERRYGLFGHRGSRECNQHQRL